MAEFKVSRGSRDQVTELLTSAKISSLWLLITPIRNPEKSSKPNGLL